MSVGVTTGTRTAAGIPDGYYYPQELRRGTEKENFMSQLLCEVSYFTCKKCYSYNIKYLSWRNKF